MTADGPARRKHTVRVAFVAAVILAALALGYYLADVLNPFLIALLIAYVLNPLVERVERRGVRRTFAVSVLFGALLFGLGTALVLGGVTAADHLEDVRTELAGERALDEKSPGDLERLNDLRTKQDPRLLKDDQGRWFLDEDFDGKRDVGVIEAITVNLTPRLRSLPQGWVGSIGKALEAQTAEALAVGVQASKGLQTFISQLWNLFGYVFLVPLYTFFLLLALSDIESAAASHLPGLYRDRIISIVARLDRSLAAFFRGRLLIAVARGLLTWLGLWLLGVRFSFFVGVVAGVLSIVPMLSFIVGGLLAVAFAYQPDSWGARCVGVLIVFSITEGLEAVGYPWLIGRNVGLHPLALILSVFCFGRLFGLFGVLLAVPIACVVKILFLEFVLPEIRALAAEVPEGASPPPAPGPAPAP
ncbi:MAG: AI-2E family transporter [Planctomycetota bacterium]